MRFQFVAVAGAVVLFAAAGSAGGASVAGKTVIRIDAKGAPSNPTGGTGSFTLKAAGADKPA